MPSAVLLVCLALSTPSEEAAAFDHGHGRWDALLRRHVVESADGRVTRVDYSALAHQRPALRAYLDALEAVTPEQYAGFGRERQLAFLINAYNAFTVELILRHYPHIDSIRDIGGRFGNPWKLRFFRLLGREHHLDDIEHRLIRAPGVFEEPRIHFAVNCAAADCPPLRAEAYVGDRLDAQLADQVRRFLANRSINRLEPGGEILRVTSLLDWYGGDFDAAGGVRAWLAAHGAALGLDPGQRHAVAEGRIRIAFDEYDWALNDVHDAGERALYAAVLRGRSVAR